MGFLKRLPGRNERGAIEVQARKTLSHIVGQIDVPYFCVAKGRINFTDPAERQVLAESFRSAWVGLSKNRSNWVGQIDHLMEHAESVHGSKYDMAVTLLLTGVLKTDMLCRVALQFPDDQHIRRIALHVLTANFGAFDLIMLGEVPASMFDPHLSTELLSELEYAQSFFDKALFAALD